MHIYSTKYKVLNRLNVVVGHLFRCLRFKKRDLNISFSVLVLFTTIISSSTKDHKNKYHLWLVVEFNCICRITTRNGTVYESYIQDSGAVHSLHSRFPLGGQNPYKRLRGRG